MRYSLLFLLLILFEGKAQNYEHPEPLMLQAGEYSRIRLPEPYSSINIPIKILEVLTPKDHDRRIIYIQPTKTEKLSTNIVILTQNYEFSLKVMINHTNKPKTSLMDLTKNIQKYEKLDFGTQKNNKPAKLFKADQFSIRNLQKIKPDLLNVNRLAPAIQENDIILSIDHIFYFNKKIVFKFSLKNNSSIPFNISKVSVVYKEFKREKLFFYKKHITNNLPLESHKIEYQKKEILPHTIGNIVYVANKIGVKNSGKFEIVIREVDGSRTFKFMIPARIR